LMIILWSLEGLSSCYLRAVPIGPDFIVSPAPFLFDLSGYLPCKWPL
jgi:hypothetical protein